jgi:hypothetical protein
MLDLMVNFNCHSNRKASIGSRRAALRAGQYPKNVPIFLLRHDKKELMPAEEFTRTPVE